MGIAIWGQLKKLKENISLEEKFAVKLVRFPRYLTLVRILNKIALRLINILEKLCSI